MVDQKSSDKDAAERSNPDEVLFTVVCKFPNNNEEEKKVMICESKLVIQLFSLIKNAYPNRTYYKLQITNDQGASYNEIDIGNDLKLFSFLDGNVPNFETRRLKEKSMEVNLNCEWLKSKNFIIHVFLNKIEDKAKDIIEKGALAASKKNKELTFPEIIYHTSYSKVKKGDNDFLAIICDESTLNDVVTNEKDIADAIACYAKPLNDWKSKYPDVKGWGLQTVSLFPSAVYPMKK